jgi:hypothetical protein
LYTQAETSKKKKAGEVLKVDTGCIIGFTKMWIMISSSLAESKLDFGGEGLFYATPRSWNRLCTIITLQRLADRIIASAPRAGGDSRGEGSLLGGLGNLLDGDNQFNNLQILTTCRFIFLDN